MIERVILTFFLTLIFNISYAQVYYSIFVKIEGNTIKGNVELKSDKDESLRLYTDGIKTKIDISTVNLRKDFPFRFNFAYKVENNRENFINGSFVQLLGNWYPIPDRDVIYRFEVFLPKGFEAVSEAEKIVKVENENGTLFRFEFEHPLDKLHLIASKEYRIYKKKYRDKEIYIYFFDRDYDLSKNYAEATIKYIREYETFLTDFPYKRFSVVENIFQTGYSMPTFTLIGDRLVKYPFMINQSLRHEILHQWFGNYVYIDFDRGNWAEGLTTYLSDHYFSEKEGKGWKYRKNTLLKYMAYTRYRRDFPVVKFRYKEDRLSEAVGYGKVMFIFHMLKNEVSEKTFFNSLKEIINRYSFKHISWDEIKRTFEKEYGRSLDRFFSQWVYRDGIPDLEVKVEDPVLKRGKFEIRIMIKQRQKFVYSLNIPVFVETVFGEKKENLYLSSRSKLFTLYVNDEPLSVSVDKNYDIFRKLAEEENIPNIASFLSSKSITVLVDKKEIKKYRPIFNLFTGKELKILQPEDVSLRELKTDVLILGRDNPVLNRLFASIKIRSNGFFVGIYENPLDHKKLVGIINSQSYKETERSYYKLAHYGTYSYLYIKDGKVEEKGQLPSERGIIEILRQETKGVPVDTTLPLKEIVRKIENKRIIYVGEQHNKFSHHIVQLNIIKAIYRKHRKIAIGMEMFQRKFQPVINDFIASKLSEREFLKKTEYFKRWGFDYNLYKPILDFARENKIPVIALNIETEILKKVSKGGLSSLTDEDTKKLPLEMDFSNILYRDRLKEIFGFHRTKRNFEYFLQSQILWDETMAETIDRFLRKNPTYKMIVLAGNGHLRYRYGIPQRCYRRNGFDYTVILNDETLDKGIGDYVLFPEHIEAEESIKLGVFVEDKGKRLKVIKVVKNSIAEKSGIKKGDVILSINGHEVRSLSDLKLELFFIKKGVENRLVVLRKGRKIYLKIKL